MICVFVVWLCEKRYLEVMDQFSNPSKKPRLDDLGDWDCNPQENEDLWGQGELTAEEFDMLEIQATQKVQSSQNCEPSVSSLSKKKNASPKFKAINVATDVSSAEDLRKQQYAAEGQVKLLSDSLDKTVRELTMERLNREKIIAEKMNEFKNTELTMKKEIEKMQTALYFKEQEMKSTYSKVQQLEQKLKEQTKDSNTNAVQQSNYSPNRSSPNNFLNRFQFKKNGALTREFGVQTVQECIARKQVLPLLFPTGEPKENDIVSRLLMNRKEKGSSSPRSLVHNFLGPTDFMPSTSVQVPLSSVARFNVGTKTNELWHSYEIILKKHISFLQSSNSKSPSLALKKIKSVCAVPGLPPPRVQLSLLEEDIEKQHNIISFCLKDLGELFLWQCPTENSHLPIHSRELSEQQWYYYKSEEVECSMRALIVWSQQNTTSLESYIHNLPLQALVAGQHNIRCAGVTLQLISKLLHLKCLESFIHQTGNCLFASVADLCHVVNDSKKDDYIHILTAIESFLCAAISAIPSIDEDNCYCSSQLIQGLIVLLRRHYEVCIKVPSSTHINLIKKGTITLHHLFINMKNFRGKRLPVEDDYVTLICGASKLSKENASFKSLRNIIHDLWDFQDDIFDETDERVSD